MKTTLLLGAALVAFATSCHDVARQEITVLSAPPLAFAVDDDSIELTEGTAVVLRITLVDADGYLFPPDEVTFSSDGAAALIVPLGDNLFVVSGAAVGTATLIGEGDAFATAARIEVEVTPQD